MLKRALILLILASLLNSTTGCHSTTRVPPERLKGGMEKIVKIALIDGRVFEFRDEGARYVRSLRQISGMALPTPDTVIYEGRPAARYQIVPVNVPIDSVREVWVQKVDPLATTFAVIGVAALVVLLTVGLIAALKESCPFVYSWDGHQYVFDAEPLGGAICEGLQRSEVSRLEHAKPENGQYRLKFRNEVPETQYLDQVQLLVVDHPANQLIVPDTSGKLHALTHLQAPVVAIDENSADILPFVRTSDGLAWQTQMSESELTRSADTRHHLSLVFPKPPDARHARLVINAGTAIWGSNMIREMLQMRGDRVDQWYEAVNRRGLRALELLSFNLREEMYLMKLYVLKDSSYVERSLVLGGGPYITEDRALDLDVSDLPGDKLTLRLNPPKGFWTIDYLAVEYDDSTLVSPTVVPIGYGRDHDGHDILPALSRIDANRYVMERMGDWADIRFDAPAPAAGLTRSVFLRTTGYYEVQIDKQSPEQTALINRLLSEPGAIGSYSVQRYLAWLHEHQQDN